MSTVTITRSRKVEFCLFCIFVLAVGSYGWQTQYTHPLAYHIMIFTHLQLYTNLGFTFPEDKDFIPEKILEVTSLESFKI